MDQYQQDLITSQLLDIGFMPHELPLDDLSYQLQDSSTLLSPPVKSEAIAKGYVDLLADHQRQLDSRSYSCSSVGSQSLSPRIHNQHPGLSHLQLNNLSFSHAPDQISPTTTNTSRKESDEESQRAERRRAQNRAAQRAYRQRKELSLKQREREVETLREELDKAQRLNKNLCKVVAILRERLKETPEESEESCD